MGKRLVSLVRKSAFFLCTYSPRGPRVYIILFVQYYSVICRLSDHTVHCDHSLPPDLHLWIMSHFPDPDNAAMHLHACIMKLRHYACIMGMCDYVCILKMCNHVCIIKLRHHACILEMRYHGCILNMRHHVCILKRSWNKNSQDVKKYNTNLRCYLLYIH